MTVLIDIHSIANKQFVVEFLYEMLRERDKNINISHKEIPTWDEHVKFVIGHNYKHWWLISNSETYIGNAYITEDNRIGLFILENYQRLGYGSETLNKIIETFPSIELYANINPSNKKSIALFGKHGFKHIQNTYKREPTS